MVDGELSDEATEAQTQLDFATCAACGESMRANSRFCAHCGAERRVGGPADGVGPDGEPTGGDILVIGPEDLAPRSEIGTAPPTDVTTEVPLVVPAVPVVPVAKASSIPPNQTVEDSEGPQPGLDRRTKLLLAGLGGLAVVALAVLAAVLFWPEAKEVDVTATVASGSQAVSGTMTQLDETNLLADFREAGATAARASEELADQSSAVDDVRDEELQAAISSLLAAEVATLSAVGDATSDIAVDDLAAWPDQSSAVNETLDEVGSAQADLNALEIEEYAAISSVDVPAAKATMDTLDQLMADKRAEYTTWQDEVDFVTQAKEQEQSALIIYGDQARDLMNEYSGLREDLQEFTDRIDREFVTIQEGYDALESAALGRRSILEQVGALDPPAAVASSHSGLVTVLGEAVAGVESAQAGIGQYLNDPFYYDLGVFDTPGWASFQSSSSRITASMDDALASWNNAVQSEASRLRSIEPPPQPEL